MPQTGREQTLKSCCAVTRGHKSGRGRFRVPQRQGFGTGMEVGEGLGFAECVRNVDPVSFWNSPERDGMLIAILVTIANQERVRAVWSVYCAKSRENSRRVYKDARYRS